MAQDTFEAQLKKGHLAFALDKNGQQGEQIKEFDPNLKNIILVPQMKGG